MIPITKIALKLKLLSNSTEIVKHAVINLIKQAVVPLQQKITSFVALFFGTICVSCQVHCCTRSSGVTWCNASQYVHDSAPNVFHLPTVNNRV